jgi:hypothetical protein
MKVDLTPSEIELILSSIGLALNVVKDTQARTLLLALQEKLMELGRS